MRLFEEGPGRACGDGLALLGVLTEALAIFAGFMGRALMGRALGLEAFFTRGALLRADLVRRVRGRVRLWARGRNRAGLRADLARAALERVEPFLTAFRRTGREAERLADFLAAMTLPLSRG